MKSFFLTIAFAAATFASAKPEISAEDIRAHIRYLASPRLAGRLSISLGFEMASQYAAQQFKKYGLRPMGSNGFFQPFEMTAGTKYGTDNAVIVAKRGHRTKLKLDTEFVPVSGSQHRWAEGSAVFVGNGSDDAASERKSDDLAGKIAIVVRETPPGSTTTTAQRIQSVFRHGATGVILCSATSQSPDAVDVGSLRVRDGVSGPIVLASRRAVEQMMGQPLASRWSSEQKRYLPQAIQDVTIRMNSDIQPNRGRSRNVIGVLPGTTKPNEFIVIGAHLDHLGFGEVSALDHNRLVHPGADDNASGSAGVMELAEYFAHTKTNQRTLVFMLFGGEEEGLLGSAYYVNHPTIDLKQVSAMLNMDMVGRLREDKLTVEGVGSSSVWSEWIDQQNSELKIVKKPEGVGPSDQTSFYEKGIPVIFLFTNDHMDYHRATDTWDKINYNGEVKVLNFAQRMVQVVDRQPEKLKFDSSSAKQAHSGGLSGSKIRIGLVPDYSFTGAGIRLNGASPGSPAERAGLRDGDVIVKWNGKDVPDLESLMPMFSTATPGVAITLTVHRRSEVLEIRVIPEALDN